MRTALINDNAGAKASADGTTSISSGGSVFSTADPTGGGVFLYARAQAKALGALASDSSNDGTVTFSSAQSCTFNPLARGGPGFDFIGVAEHAISEVMGRFQLNGANLSGSPNYTAYDLFDFSGVGAHSLLTGAGRCFSINNGTTNLRRYNNAATFGGDSGDWDSAFAISPYNASTGPNTAHAIQSYDIATLDVIGWERAAVVPEPGKWAMMLAGIAVLGGLARRRNAT